ncbi:MAG: hypothetical protein IJ680_03600 [Paludibacteraceae bacterium]|nr:hypothetical protein [Paludibacteraceae bacterium]
MLPKFVSPMPLWRAIVILTGAVVAMRAQTVLWQVAVNIGKLAAWVYLVQALMGENR